APFRAGWRLRKFAKNSWERFREWLRDWTIANAVSARAPRSWTIPFWGRSLPTSGGSFTGCMGAFTPGRFGNESSSHERSCEAEAPEVLHSSKRSLNGPLRPFLLLFRVVLAVVFFVFVVGVFFFLVDPGLVRVFLQLRELLLGGIDRLLLAFHVGFVLRVLLIPIAGIAQAIARVAVEYRRAHPILPLLEVEVVA